MKADHQPAILVTPSARDELLETVVRLRQRNREEAALFVERVQDRLTALATGEEGAPELDSPWRAADATHGHRLYLRERSDGLWLIAVWPEDSPNHPVEC